MVTGHCQFSLEMLDAEGKDKPDVCCQNLVLLIQTHNLLKAGAKNIDLKNFRFQDRDDMELRTHEMANLRGTESSPFITGRSIEL